MPDDDRPTDPSAGSVSRRNFLRANVVLLAGVGLTAVVGGGRADAAPAPGSAPAADGGDVDLARYRPVTVSSTDYAPVPAQFAVDGLAVPGVRGSGWRAVAGDPQWITVDLQSPCEIDTIGLVFEAMATDPPFVPASGINPFLNTTGFEVLSSCALAYRIEVSADNRTWRSVYETGTGTGGAQTITLPVPVTARWVRLTSTARANDNPLGLNGFQVYGRPLGPRPHATGWTDWGRHRQPAPNLRIAADGTVALESGWMLTMDDWAGSTDGAALSSATLDTTAWLPAVVPGTVHAALVAQGHLPEPTIGFNNMRAPEALSRHSWWYHRAFDVPTGFATGPARRVWLELDGIDHRAQVWLNGTVIGELTHPVARAAFDVTGALLADGRQGLAVRIDPMPHPGNPGDKGPSGVSTLNSNAEQQDLPGYISISGWDWMPAVRDRAAGIWNHVRLRATGDIVLGDPHVDTRLPGLPDLSIAEVTLTVPVRNASTQERTATVSASIAGATVHTTATLAPGASADVAFTPAQYPQLRLSRPELWWPNGYGEPALHELTTTARIGATISDTRTVSTGLRQYGYHYEQPIVINPATDHSAPQTVELPAQTARYLRIQGGKRATGWGISLWTLSVLDSARPGTDLALKHSVTASSQDNDNDGPANAVDGDDNTRWSSGYSDNQWIQVDLGSSLAFDQVVLTWETAYALTFTVQVSDDGSTWTDVKAVSNTGTELQISVNGVRVMCRGGNWGFDELLRRVLPDRMDDTVAMHRDMNFTMIRNWVGSSNREEFFAACDVNGILVWNDFWAGDAIFPPDNAVFLDIAKDTVIRYRHHPCIAVWCATNESDPPADMDTGLRALIAANQPEILYQGNSAGGIVTGHGPYSWIEPAQYFDGATYSIGSYGFHTEIGIPTVPVAETMRHLAADSPAWPIGDVWYLHDWCTRGGQQPQTYQAAIEQRLGPADSLEDFCAKAQFVNYESMRAIFEAYNAALWDDASGVLLWMSHPAHHSTTWQTYDYDLDVNGSYYGARKGCEPLHVQARLSDWQVHAVNQTANDLRAATVQATLYDLNGNALGAQRQAQIDVSASSAVASFTVPFDADLPAAHLLRLSLLDAGQQPVSDNTYLRYRTASDVRAVSALAGTRVTASAGPVGSRADRDGATVTVRNSGGTVAAMIRVSVLDATSRNRVLPSRYSENYLWLLPGESRQIDVSWPRRCLPGGRPLFGVEALNVTKEYFS
jgi:hypothetical protein